MTARQTRPRSYICPWGPTPSTEEVWAHGYRAGQAAMDKWWRQETDRDGRDDGDGEATSDA